MAYYCFFFFKFVASSPPVVSATERQEVAPNTSSATTTVSCQIAVHFRYFSLSYVVMNWLQAGRFSLDVILQGIILIQLGIIFVDF